MKKKLLICKNKITYRNINSEQIIEKAFELSEQTLKENMVYISNIDENYLCNQGLEYFHNKTSNTEDIFKFIESLLMQNIEPNLLFDIAVEENIINKFHDTKRESTERYYTVVYNIINKLDNKSIANEFMVFDSLDENAYYSVSNRIEKEINWSKLKKVLCIKLPKQWIFSAQASGFFFHECIGHLLEEEQFRLSDIKLGDKLFNANISIYENWEMEDILDDYDNPVIKNICLVKNGKVQNILSSSAIGPSSGNAYTQEPFVEPMARMNCMYVKDEKNTEHIMDNVKSGIFIEEISCGEYNSLNGEIGLSINKAYKIKDGKIGEPYLPFSILFNIMDLVSSYIILDNKYETVMSLCGKYGAVKKIKYIVPEMMIDWSNNAKFPNNRNI